MISVAACLKLNCYHCCYLVSGFRYNNEEKRIVVTCLLELTLLPGSCRILLLLSLTFRKQTKGFVFCILSCPYVPLGQSHHCQISAASFSGLRAVTVNESHETQESYQTVPVLARPPCFCFNSSLYSSSFFSLFSLAYSFSLAFSFPQ